MSVCIYAKYFYQLKNYSSKVSKVFLLWYLLVFKYIFGKISFIWKCLRKLTLLRPVIWCHIRSCYGFSTNMLMAIDIHILPKLIVENLHIHPYIQAASDGLYYDIKIMYLIYFNAIYSFWPCTFSVLLVYTVSYFKPNWIKVHCLQYCLWYGNTFDFQTFGAK